MSRFVVSRPPKMKNSSKNNLLHRFHPARLLYVFTAALLINIFWSLIQATLVASDPAAIFDLDQLKQTFIGHLAVMYPLIFWLTVGVCLVATGLGWYLDRRYKKRQREEESRTRQQEMRDALRKEKDTDKVALIPAHELHYENFNLGDDAATYFPYIIAPVRDAYDGAIDALHVASNGTKSAKRGFLALGEANSGKTRLAVEVLKKTLPSWLVLHWYPGDPIEWVPTKEGLQGNNVIVFVDDLQKYVQTEQYNIDNIFLLVSNLQAQTLRTLLKRVYEASERVVVIATCRSEDEGRARAQFNELFEELAVIRLPRFSMDTEDAEAAEIIMEFKKQGAEHIQDWDGTLGSLVLGLSRKRSRYDSLVVCCDPAATILRAMKLLTLAGTVKQTEQQLRGTCTEVFGEADLKQKEKVWRAAIEHLTRMQFIREEIDKNGKGALLTIRKDIYFDQIVIDYPQLDRPYQLQHDFMQLQRVFVELRDVWPLCNLGFLYINLNQYEEALAAFDHALAIDPENSSVLVVKGIALMALEKSEEALAALDHALAIDPENPLVSVAKGMVMIFLLKQPEEALAMFGQALVPDLSHPIQWLARVAKGFKLMDLDQPQEAAAIFSQIRAPDPQDALGWYVKGSFLSLLDHDKEAVAAFENALALKPNYVEAWYQKGIALVNLKQYEEAVAALDRVLATYPNHVEAWYQKGIVLSVLDHDKEAVAALDRALALKPNHFNAWYRKGIALFAMDHSKEAVAALDRALALKPDYADTWYRKGIALVNLKQYEEAVAALNKASALDSKNADAWFLKGAALMMLHRIEEAMAAINHSISLGLSDTVLTVIKDKGLDLQEVLQKFQSWKENLARLKKDREKSLEEIRRSLENIDHGLAQYPTNADLLQLRAHTLALLEEAQAQKSELDEMERLYIGKSN